MKNAVTVLVDLDLNRVKAICSTIRFSKALIKIDKNITEVLKNA